MPTCLSPGVYVKEVSGGVKPIAGVGTSVGAFVGIAEKGEIGKAKLITNWSQFVKEFGGFIPDDRFLAYAVFSFFAEGGTSCYVVRVASTSGPGVSSSAIFDNGDETPVDVLTVTASSEGTWGDSITVEIADPTDESADTHFKLTVTYGGEIPQVFDNISIADVEDIVSSLINVNLLEGINIPDPLETESYNTYLTNHRPINATKSLIDGSDPPATSSSATFDNRDAVTSSNPLRDVLEVTASSEGTWGDRITVEITKHGDEKLLETYYFKLTVTYGDEKEVFDNITIADVEDKIDSSFINADISDEVTILSPTDPGFDTFLTNNRPSNTIVPGPVSLEGGLDPNTPSSVTLTNAANDKVLDITASKGGAWGDSINVKITDPDYGLAPHFNTHFNLTVTCGNKVEVFKDISMDSVKNDEIDSSLINVALHEGINIPDPTDTNYVQLLTTNRPSNTLIPGPVSLSGGKDGLDNLINADYIGDEDNKKGLHAFDEVDDVNIVAIPDMQGNREVILAALNYCKDRGDCFFIVDPPPNLVPTDVMDFKNAGGDYNGNVFNSSYGALYYPWIYVTDPLSGGKKPMPPSGAVAGTYAYTDSARGVHKAPAGISEGYLDSVVGIEKIITKGEHDLLNPAGINVIRSFPAAGICIWGARTLSADSEWLYVNVRRLLLYIEESIDKGTQWVVFEPNDPTLWGRVKRNITAFLLRVWRDGALFGSTPDEAFFVKVDAENNPPEVRDAGQLIIEVGVAPVKPAEFVIIKISQKTLTK